jgi:protease IV
MRYKGLWITLLILFLLGGSFLFGMIIYLLSSGERSSGFFSSSGIGVITVEGPIIEADDVLRDIRELKERDDVKSVILRIDSPGGAVAASQEIFEAVQDIGKKKPVIASMGSVAASGGYYVACAAEKILANAGTTTGSIGVRLEHIMIGELLDWAKIKHETLKSGKLKNMMPIDKPISPEARKILQSVLDDIHEQFKKVVVDSRKLDKKFIDEIADGRIFTGEQALSLKLVDQLGGFTLAIQEAAKLAEIEGEPKLIYPRKHMRFIERIVSETRALIFSEKMMNYWQPMLMIKTNEASL